MTLRRSLWLPLGLASLAGTCEGRDCPTCDEDGDGITAQTDCDDADPTVGVGEDWRPDCDEDGLGGPTVATACELPPAADLFDLCGDGGVWIGADEGLDCDDADADVGAGDTWYADCDADGVAGEQTTLSCVEPTSTEGTCPTNGGAWTDAPPATFDCNDDDATGFTDAEWFADCDGDGVPGDLSLTRCGVPDSGSDLDGCSNDPDWFDTAPDTFDCADDDVDRAPGAIDPFGDGVDRDCDGADNPSLDGGVFVATWGVDSAAGTIDAPVRTITRGLELAGLTHMVHVGAGTYDEEITVSGRLAGGYSPNASWTWNPFLYATRVRQPVAGGAAPVHLRDLGPPIDLTGVTVEGFPDAIDVTTASGLTEARLFRLNLTSTVRLDDVAGTLERVNGLDLGVYPGLVITGTESAVRLQNCNFDHLDASTGNGALIQVESGIVVADACVLGPSFVAVQTRGDLTVRESSVQGTNLGIQSLLGAVRVEDSHVEGGSMGLLADGGTVTAVRSTLAGGASAAGRWTFGAGAMSGGTLTLVSSVATGGSRSDASGVFVWGGTVRLFGVTAIGGTSTTTSGAEVHGDATFLAVNSVFHGGTGTTAQALRVYEDGGYPEPIIALHGALLTGPTAVLHTDVPNFEDTTFDFANAGACGFWGCDALEALVTGDPAFVDPPGADYGLSDGSPAIDVGVAPTPYTPPADVTTDLIGGSRPAGGGWDLGAVER